MASTHSSLATFGNEEDDIGHDLASSTIIRDNYGDDIGRDLAKCKGRETNTISAKATTIISLPKEVTLEIMKCSSAPGILNAPALALGLTCHLFYALLKSEYDLNVLSELSPEGLPTEPIIRVIAGFLGPNYRFVYISESGYFFLNREVYGNQRGTLIVPWHSSGSITCIGGVYAAQAMLEFRCRWWETTKSLSQVKAAGCLLPNPRGMGREWHAEAERVVLGETWKTMKNAHRNSFPDPDHDDYQAHTWRSDLLDLVEKRMVHWAAKVLQDI